MELRGLFQKHGEMQTPSVPWRPSIEEYIEARHSQNGLSRDRMGKERAAAFDAEIRKLLLGLCKEGKLELQVHATVIWGIAIIF